MKLNSVEEAAAQLGLATRKDKLLRKGMSHHQHHPPLHHLKLSLGKGVPKLSHERWAAGSRHLG